MIWMIWSGFRHFLLCYIQSARLNNTYFKTINLVSLPMPQCKSVYCWNTCRRCNLFLIRKLLSHPLYFLLCFCLDGLSYPICISPTYHVFSYQLFFIKTRSLNLYNKKDSSFSDTRFKGNFGMTFYVMGLLYGASS